MENYSKDPERFSVSSHESDLETFPMDLIGSGVDATDSTVTNPLVRRTSTGSVILEIPPSPQHHDTDQVDGLTDYIGQEAENKTTANSLHADSKSNNCLDGKTASGTDSSSRKASRCHHCRQVCLSCCRPCLTEYNSLTENPSTGQRLRYALLCPPHGKLARWFTQALAVVIVWGVLWAITGSIALPGGSFFALVVLLVLGTLAGALVEKIHLPALLGMLLVGCLLRNVPKVNIAKDIDPQWAAALRNVALVVILTRAGLGLDPVALRKLSFGVIRLAFIPCLIETLTAAVTSHFLLGFPWIWGFMLGFVLSAVSPAVVVPSMLSLNERGYGVEKGIPTLVIAAASVDDVLAISGFGVVLGIAFSKGNLVLMIFKGPLEAVAGVLFGVLFGICCWYIPHRKHERKTLFRFVLLFGGGLFATFGSRAADISGAGALACLTLAFVAALAWRKESEAEQQMPIASIMGVMWTFFQPLLFGLIGAEVDITSIQPETIGLGIAILFIGLTTRIVASFMAVFKLGLTWKEMFFIPFAWLPKATVQAAIGSMALDTARDKNAPADQIELGLQLLTIAVLVILITAPLGAIAIALTAPRLLKKTTRSAVDVIVTPPSTPHGDQDQNNPLSPTQDPMTHNS